MKRTLKQFSEKLTDLFFKDAVESKSFGEYHVYDPEALQGLALISEGIIIIGNMIDKMEEMEQKIEELELRVLER